MLQSASTGVVFSAGFDLAPTGALCYNWSRSSVCSCSVLISLPQERCATLADRATIFELPF